MAGFDSRPLNPMPYSHRGQVHQPEGDALTDEQTKDYIAALVRELHGYEVHGDTDGAKAVNAELKRLGAHAKPPAKRATKLTKKAAQE